MAHLHAQRRQYRQPEVVDTWVEPVDLRGDERYARIGTKLSNLALQIEAVIDDSPGDNPAEDPEE